MQIMALMLSNNSTKNIYAHISLFVYGFMYICSMYKWIQFGKKKAEIDNYTLCADACAQLELYIRHLRSTKNLITKKFQLHLLASTFAWNFSRT